MQTKVKKSGEVPDKLTKYEVLGYINFFMINHGVYPTVDDIAEKLGRPRKVMADFLSRYARYGIVDAYKEQGKKTRYGPGINWAKIDNLEWYKFFRAGKCPHCNHAGVLGVLGPKTIMFRCKWCRAEWREDREWVDKSLLEEIDRQAQKTKRQWDRGRDSRAEQNA